ncbi:sulfatase [Paenibacillus sp. F411]|uniref:sulfatase n=1 Tax=Paenibacillus sp. F411 TaxID=2820239 RepID=UPI001AAE8C6B|nr:sulfatase [Paenibacillus sp. F411]MBO2944879.1 sulfatase [Paenibacillus sp. F411]
MRTIFILMDSLNRHMLKSYNPHSWVKTPNIDRLADQSISFDNHWAGSLPCMPARRDLFTGCFNFLERGWGPIEPFDITFQKRLRAYGIFTHLVTDHYHYFELGGENYCQQFNTWDFIRGQEYDPWVSRVDQPALPESHYGKISAQYELNCSRFHSDADYPSPRTFASACEWLESNREAQSFFLMVEAFDPHEPFDCTKEFLDLYENEDEYTGPHYNWSGYKPVDVPYAAITHLRKRYAATLSMNDKWLGKLLDTIDQLDMDKDTTIILTTDHGHLLGEHNFIGKNEPHVYNEIAHLPLFIRLPGGERAQEHVSTLTQTVDLMPTILDLYGIPLPERLHGRSIHPILIGGDQEESVRDYAIYGYHGKAVNITDGVYTYFRAPVIGNSPCFSYCGIPTTLWSFLATERASQFEVGRFLTYTDHPVYKIPMHGTKHELIEVSQLFHIQRDYGQRSPIHDKDEEEKWMKRLSLALHEYSAPEEQWKRLGLERQHPVSNT